MFLALRGPFTTRSNRGEPVALAPLPALWREQMRGQVKCRARVLPVAPQAATPARRQRGAASTPGRRLAAVPVASEGSHGDCGRGARALAPSPLVGELPLFFFLVEKLSAPVIDPIEDGQRVLRGGMAAEQPAS